MVQKTASNGGCCEPRLQKLRRALEPRAGSGCDGHFSPDLPRRAIGLPRATAFRSETKAFLAGVGGGDVPADGLEGRHERVEHDEVEVVVRHCALYWCRRVVGDREVHGQARKRVAGGVGAVVIVHGHRLGNREHDPLRTVSLRGGRSHHCNGCCDDGDIQAQLAEHRSSFLPLRGVVGKVRVSLLGLHPSLL
jgi:hypothetical protein